MKIQTVLLLLIFLVLSCQGKKEEYVCTPCNLPCDTIIFNKPGICPHCNMKLLKKKELIDESALVLNQISLAIGSGVFLIEGGKGKERKTIKVYYHKPLNYSKNSRILMVIPGAGRNGDSYRDAWKEESEKYSVLILSPKFDEEKYPFESYHLCGLMQESNLLESIHFSEDSNIANLNEEMFTFKLSLDADNWIFKDFDRIFDLVVKATGASPTTYDLFGHSAGGQIIHRMAIFAKQSKVHKMVAANAGFYTLPDFETKMPFGIQNTNMDTKNLKHSFSKELIILIGQLDNENEKGGTLLRSKTVDQQGTHRYSRAQYFYEFSKQKAIELEADWKWKMEVVPNVGHDHEIMGNHAAKLLYE